MKFNGQKHFRGMHGLSGEPDHKVLARARLKGLHIHPSVLDTVYDPVLHQGECKMHTPPCKTHALESTQRIRIQTMN